MDLDANDKLIALATKRGLVHVLDLSGGPIRRFDVHTMPPNAIHIDESGEYISSCSDEGRVVVHALYGHDSETQTFDYGEALTCVRLSPGYAKQNELLIGSFDGQLRLKAKNWFGQMRDESIHMDKGRIEEMAWQPAGAFLAWASDLGVKIFDCKQRKIIGHIPPFGSITHRCHLCWSGTQTLLIGWGHAIRAIEIQGADSTPGSIRRTDSSGQQDYTVRVTAKFDCFDFVCAGVAPFGRTEIMVLCVPTHEAAPDPVPGDSPSAANGNGSLAAEEYVSIARGMVREGFEMDSPPVGALEKGESVIALESKVNEAGIKRIRFSRGWTSEKSKNGQTILEIVSQAQAQAGNRRPQLRIFSYTGQTLLMDVMDVRGFREAEVSDYRLRHAAADDELHAMFLVMAPHDVLVVKRRDAADRVDFLLHRGDTEEALALAESRLATGEISRARLLSIAHRWIDELFDQQRYADAAKQCSRLLGEETAGWERWLYAFAEQGQLRAIAPSFCERRLQGVPPVLYEMVLQLYIESADAKDHATLFRLLQRWPAESYDIPTVTAALAERLREVGPSPSATENGAGLADSLALLLTYRGEHRRSLDVRVALALAAKREAEDDPLQDEEKRAELGMQAVLDYIDSHGLHMFLRRLVRPLIELHADKALGFFVWHATKIPIGDVAPQLQGREKDATHFHKFLRKVFERDPHAGTEYHTCHVEYLAEHAEEEGHWLQEELERAAAAISTAHVSQQASQAAAAAAATATEPESESDGDESGSESSSGSESTDSSESSVGERWRERDEREQAELRAQREQQEREQMIADGLLLTFLKTSRAYELQKAYEVCRKRKLYPCIVYVLGRMGRARAALEVIIDDMHDMPAAIAFVKRQEPQKQSQLWAILLERALSEPPATAGLYVGQLLESTSPSDVDLLMLIERIPPGLEIPAIREKLARILREYTFANRLRAGCLQVAGADGYVLAEASLKARRRAVCYRPVTNDDGERTAERYVTANPMRGGGVFRPPTAKVDKAAAAASTERAVSRLATTHHNVLSPRLNWASWCSARRRRGGSGLPRRG